MATQTAGSRRVISLCFLLALVIVLMQKASDPKHVRNAFSALGVPFDRQAATASEQPSPQPKSQEGGSPVATGDQRADAKWLATCNDLIPRLFDEATNQQLLEFSRRWFAEVELAALPNDAQEQAEAETALTQLRENSEQQLAAVAEQLGQLPDAEKADWERQLVRFESEWNGLWDSVQQGKPLDSSSSALANVITGFLDAKLMGLMRDAAPWSNAETVPFLRLMQRGQQPLADDMPDPPLLNTLQLEAELSVYRGELVRFRGEVRRVDVVQRPANAFGLEQYWALWLRGEDGAFQPVAVYTTNSIAGQLQRAVDGERFPAIEVLGVVGKRLAYASQEGVEVAPTIFAQSILQFAEDSLPATVENSDRSLAKEFGWTVLVGLLIAGLVLTPILANWRRRTVRSIRRNSSGLILLAALFPTYALAQENASVKPPWAELEEDPLNRMLVERLDTAFTEAGLDELHTFLNGDSRHCPDAVLKTMHALRQLGWSQVLSSERRLEFSSEQLLLKDVELQGFVRLAMPVELDEDQQQWYQRNERDQLYRIEVEPSVRDSDAEGAELQSVFCASVPSQWMASVQLKQPVVVPAMQLLQLDAAGAMQSVCYFARVPQWKSLPSAKSSFGLQPSLPVHQRFLGSLGWDLANLDVVGRYNQEPIQAAESEAFYSLMRVMDGVRKPGGERTSVQQALSEPAKRIGAPVDWRVRLVNGSEVEVTSDAERQALGADRYYQFDGFVDMGNQIVHYRLSGENRESSDHDVVDFENEFPITVVMRAPSQYVPQAELQNGQKSWSVGKYVRVSGVLYRLWSFRSQMMENKSTTARQAAPLVVAGEMLADTPPIRPPESPIGWFGYALCAATLVILAGILYAAFHPDPKNRRNPHVS